VYQGKRTPPLAQCFERLLELRELFFGMCRLGIVGISQMGHEPFKSEGGLKGRQGGEIRHLARAYAQAAHTGFDFDMHGVGRGIGWDGRGKGLDHISPIEHGRQTMCG